MWFLCLLSGHMHYDMKTRVHSNFTTFCWMKIYKITEQENKFSTKAETVMWIIDLFKYAACILCFVLLERSLLSQHKKLMNDAVNFCLLVASPKQIYCFYLFSFRAIINSADSIILFRTLFRLFWRLFFHRKSNSKIQQNGTKRNSYSSAAFAQTFLLCK